MNKLEITAYNKTSRKVLVSGDGKKPRWRTFNGLRGIIVNNPRAEVRFADDNVRIAYKSYLEDYNSHRRVFVYA